MLCIGITGGIGAGKSTVTTLFSSLGIPIIDADMIAREITSPKQPALDKIVQHFGKQLLDEKQHLNRSLLKEIIFNHPEEKKWLENLLHPIIIKEIHRQKRESTAPYCIVSAPLLMEANAQDSLVDRVLVIDADPKMQIDRTKKRDHLSEKQIIQIMQSQLSRKERLDKADDVIENNADVEILKDQVKKLHHYYIGLATL